MGAKAQMQKIVLQVWKLEKKLVNWENKWAIYLGCLVMTLCTCNFVQVYNLVIFKENFVLIEPKYFGDDRNYPALFQ